jgi:ligand-binding sensor domain-containing protein/two-component sensor histidine kinase
MDPARAAGNYKPEIADPLFESWRWQHYAYLSGKGIRCFTQDKDNNTWFGVDKGIIRYNGFSWNTYTPEDGLLGAPVECIYTANDGSIYAGTAEGLSRFQEGAWRAIFPLAGDSLFHVSSIIQLSDGSVAAGTDRGLLHFKDDRITLFATQKTIVGMRQVLTELSYCQIPDAATFDNTLKVFDLFQDNQDRVWISMGDDTDEAGKILQFALPAVQQTILKSYTIFGRETGFRLGSRMHFLQSLDKKIWIISEDYDIGIYRVDQRSWAYFQLSEQFGGDDLHTSIISTTDGTVWIGGLAKLYAYKNDKWYMYKAPDVSLPISRLLLMESNDGQLWIAGKQNEVYQIDYAGTFWMTYRNLNFQCETTDESRWFLSVDDRVVRQQGSVWTSFGQEDGLMQYPVCIMVTSKGQIWAAGSQEEVAATAYFENEKWHRQLHPNLSWGVDYRAVFEGPDGSIWFGCAVDIHKDKGQLAGALRLKNPTSDTKEWIQYTSADGIDQENAYGLAQSPDGQIWMGGSSLFRFDGERWHRQTEPQQVAERVDIVHSRFRSKLWIGSRFYGIFSFDGNKWRQYKIEDGLLSNTIISIYAQSDSSVWVATDRDICRFDGRNWTTDLFPAELTFTREGGALNMSKDGALWINISLREWKRRALKNVTLTEEALNKFFTVKYKPDNRPPDTDIKIYLPEVDQSGNTVISWTGHDAWDITPQEELTYSYRLNEQEWSPFQPAIHHTFTSLKSGTYRFEVRSRDKDFNVDPTPAVAEFRVMLPVYLRAWFIGLMAVLLSIIGYLTVRLIQRNVKLGKANQKLQVAKKETDDILHNVEEGLFLLDPEYVIGSQYSTILETILNQKILAQINFVKLLQDKISGTELETVKHFLTVIFTQDIDPEMLDDLNPLSEIKLDFGDYKEPKYLSFKFRRVDADPMSHRELIVTVRDISEQVLLEQKLRASEEESQRQMDWLLCILHVEPSLLQEFISTAQQEIDNISATLERGRKSANINFNEILTQVYRSMHLLKGNASLLAIKFFADQAHQFESKISELLQNQKLKNEDLLPLKTELEKIKIMLNEVNKLIDKISQIHNYMRPKREHELKMLMQSLNNLVLRSVHETGKKIHLNTDKFEGNIIPHQYKLLLKEILIQLIRNSIAHGIEDPEERLRQNKPEAGIIEISTVKRDDQFCLIIRDDGRGLQIDKLKSAARKLGKWSEQEINNWSDKEIANSIFVSGITTADAADLMAGRGVGLDAIKEKIEKHQGKIELEYEAGKYCQFEVCLKLN